MISKPVLTRIRNRSVHRAMSRPGLGLMRKSVLAALLAMALGAAVSMAAGEAELAGTWKGALDVQGMSLDLIFHVSQKDDGTLSVKLDVPAQGVVGFGASSVSVANEAVTITFQAMGAVYSGKVDSAAEKIEGSWSQGGLALPLNLERTTDLQPQRKPQEPVPPYPYREEEVSYRSVSEGVVLGGTLTIPEGDRPFPAVLLVSGSGAQDRNESIMGHKPFLVLADYLTRLGIAVLRTDDRGVGASSGNFALATVQDFADDAEGGFRYLLSRTDIDHSRIGLIGHSEGGMVVPIVASRVPDVAFAVLLAGPGFTGDVIVRRQLELILRAEGAGQDIIDREVELQDAMVGVVKKGVDTGSAISRLTEILTAYLDKLSPEERAKVGDERTFMARQINTVLSPWFKGFITTDPADYLKKVSCPVLALGGSKDLQVEAGPNLKAIEEALRTGGNTDVTAIEIPGLNHLFQTTNTGAVSEYGTLKETFSPVALEIIGQWVMDKAGLTLH